MRITLWRMYYRFVDSMLDDAWERDVAKANEWARAWFIVMVLVMSIAYWLVFDGLIRIEMWWTLREILG